MQARRAAAFPQLRIASTLALGLVITALLFSSIRHFEHRAVETDFQRQAEVRLTAVRDGLNQAVEVLNFVNGALDSYGLGNAAQFHQLTQPLLARHDYIRALGFRRHLFPEQKAAFEARMRRVHPGFAVKDLVDGQLVPASGRGPYRVVEYLEPLSGNEAALGLNAYSVPAQLEALQASLRTGLPASSLPFPLVQSMEASDGIVIMMPLYDGSKGFKARGAHATVIGDTSMVINVSKLVQSILGNAGIFKAPGLNISVYLGREPNESQLIFRQGGVVAAKSTWLGLPSWLFFDQPESISRTMQLADQPWHLVVSQEGTWFGLHHTGSPLVLLAGLFLTVVAAAWMHRWSGRSHHIQQLVTERTMELTASKERFRHLINMSSDWYWEQDRNLRLTTATAGPNCEPPFDLSKCLGRTIEEMPYQIIATEDTRDRYNAAVAAREPYRDIVVGFYGGDAKLRYFSINADPLFDSDGTFTGYLGTGKDISEHKLLEMQLWESKQRLREHALHQDSIREDERKRIAREIHDELGQNLLALRMEASVLQLRTAAHSRLNARVKDAIMQIDATMRTVKQIINNLRPVVLDLGLRPAIEWQLSQFEKRHRITCQLDWQGNDATISEQLATTLFRVVQESLTNIARHAHATKAHVLVCIDDRAVKLAIRDDGIGLNLAKPKKSNSFGLMGIEERIRALQGQLYIAGSADTGTSITITIPMENRSAPKEATYSAASGGR